LVVSDLHIGSAVEPSHPGFIKQIGAFNHAFCRFLEYYAERRVDDRPWRLVIAGDMIDFLRASLTRASDQFEGPRGAERAAVAALDRIVHHNRKVFRDLATFVAAGNDLVVLKGNHDAEFHWEEVQTRFAELLVELFGEQKDPAPSAEDVLAFRTRISFCRWFYYERDLVYIEHGNQYDEFCSFEHVLAPVIPEDAELEDPISHRLFRDFAEWLDSIDVHVVEHWKMADYARWLVGMGPRVLAKMAYTYFGSIAWMLRTRRRLARATQKAREEHRSRIAQLTHRFRITEDVVHKLDELRRRPASNSVLAGMGMLYMDQLFLGALTILALLAALLVPSAWLWKGSVAAGALAASAVIAFLRSRLRQVESHPKLLDRARRLGDLLKVPYIVMGHSHVPVVTQISPDRGDVYINTGSWTHEGRKGLTHLCILIGQEKPKAELRRWDIETQTPAEAEI
jgi:UDP-2,3-diacylglucosamine pyrophosphatase LpxH